MPRFNRLLGFVSVSFVLLFIAKINKMELYTAYFRTIADVEVRNSHALLLQGMMADAVAAELAPSAPTTPSAGLLPTAFALQLEGPAPVLRATALAEAPAVRQVFLPQTAPRAPDGRA